MKNSSTNPSRNNQGKINPMPNISGQSGYTQTVRVPPSPQPVPAPQNNNLSSLVPTNAPGNSPPVVQPTVPPAQVTPPPQTIVIKMDPEEDVELEKARTRERQKQLISLIKWVVILIVLLVAAGVGSLFNPQVREFVFDTGPLTSIEQSYVNDLTQINESAGNNIGMAYNCLLTSGQSCSADSSFKTAYVQLGAVRDKFQALSLPSNRFREVANMHSSLYTSLGGISDFAFQTITTKRVAVSQVELLTRLDSSRKLLEQAKADLKATVLKYTKK